MNNEKDDFKKEAIQLKTKEALNKIESKIDELIELLRPTVESPHDKNIESSNT